MKTTSFFAIHLLTGAARHTAAFAPPSPKASFPSCPAASSSVFPTTSAKSKATCATHPSTSTSTTTRLYSSTDDESGPEPLATEGDWTAYLDDENTGYIYYFNGVTGESRWEKPTASFPDVDVESAKRKVEREKRRVERRERRERRAASGESAEETGAVETNAGGAGDTSGGGGFFGFFGSGGGEGKTTEAEASKVNIREVVSNNDAFLGDIDDVIAEAEEAIKIAEEVEQQQPVKKSLFSAFGFGSGKDRAAEAEERISRLEAKAKEIEQGVENTQQKQASGGGFFSSFGFGGEKAEPVKEVVEEVVGQTTLDGDNIWVEGLKNLFSRTTLSFTPPKMSSTPTTTDAQRSTQKIVTPKKEEPASKASVSESDFLDVVWGAETSARPTLNIAEMMKSFQVQSKEPIEVEKAPTVEKFRTVTLDASLQIKPHPDKVSWGGEDAAFSNGRTFGVFDGVSGAEKVKGKKLYSVILAESMKKKCGKGGLSVVDITNYMNEAKEFADSEGTGASTAVVASIGEDNMLRALNLGDSVCLVLRDGTVAARTREIIHYFDCPYQLGEDSPDRPKDGTTLQTEIYSGDIIVAGSDGVFDNLSDADVCGIVESCPPKAKSAAIAKKIVELSRAVSLDKSAVTPYSTVARGRSGYDAYKSGRGGKVDDISCIVVKAS
mmetsp:Transcript_11183/g.22949  ORF Transcript_11183/g.22949 Transcript_11183/m.22949 type:complete len:666 (+) Transcript_11183:98-2095(+)